MWSFRVLLFYVRVWLKSLQSCPSVSLFFTVFVNVTYTNFHVVIIAALLSQTNSNKALNDDIQKAKSQVWTDVYAN